MDTSGTESECGAALCGSFTQSNLRDFSSSISAFAAWTLLASVELPTITPVGTLGVGPVAKKNGVGSPTFQCAACNADAMSVAKAYPSLSALTTYKFPVVPEKLPSREPIAVCCSLLSLRQATVSSILIRARRSSSAALLTSAISAAAFKSLAWLNASDDALKARF